MKTIKLSLLILTLAIFSNVFGQKAAVEGLRQPAQLFVDHETSDSNAYLYWWNPGDPTWLWYYRGVQGLLTFNTGHYEVAIKYDKQDFAPYHGMELKTLAVAAGAENVTYTLNVWTGDGSTVEYTQEIPAATPDNWTYVDLTTPLRIDTSKTYYIGLEVDILADGTAGVGVDYGPAVEGGKGSLIRNSSGDFISLTEYEIDYNWAMAIYLEEASSTAKRSVEPIFAEAEQCITNIGEPIKVEFATLDTKQAQASSTLSYFNIYRNDEIIGTSDTVGYHDILKLTGEYTYEVSAVYNEGESHKSNAFSTFYDNDRIPKNIMVVESFINTFDLTEETLSSPGSPGVYKGIHEMDYQWDIAPIVYHSAAEILGPDPFSFAGSEDRFMQYFMYTFAFPSTHFNGSNFIGGGQDESMYFIYRDVYNAIKNVKTPVAQSTTIEGITSTSYNVNTELELVGVYDLTHVVALTVVTEKAIAYPWGVGDEFEKVSFVARDIVPSINGSSLTFTDNKASVTHSIETDPFVNSNNYSIITFIQDTTTLEILNAERLDLPGKKVITFNAKRFDDPVKNVDITINEQTVTTDRYGIAQMALYPNNEEVSYSVACEGYNSYTSSFNPSLVDTVNVPMSLVGVNINAELNVNVFPNPAVNTLTIQANQNSNVIITDLSGSIVRDEFNLSGQKTIDISDMETGVYFIQINSNNKHIVKKFIKQ